MDVAHGIFKDPELPDDPDPDHLYRPVNAPSAYHHRPELQQLYRSWRAILDSYPADGFPGARTAVGEVWADTPDTLRPYLEPGGLPQVFNFELIVASWDVAGFRHAIDGVLALADGSRAPWVIGNHDVPRPVSRYQLDEGFGPQTISQLVRLGHTRPETGARRARAAALLLLALPGSAYVYQGEELGLPEVADLPAAARQDPRFRRTHGKLLGRDGCRVPLPWTGPARTSASPRPPRPRRPGSPSPRNGAATASRRSSTTRIRSSACTGRPCGCAASTRPSAAARCAGSTDRTRPTACSASPESRASSSRPTSAGSPRRSRRTARSCWPASRTRSAPTGACGPIPRCGCPPDVTAR